MKRFTGNQIAKIFQQKSTVEAYREFDKTEVCVGREVCVVVM